MDIALFISMMVMILAAILIGMVLYHIEHIEEMGKKEANR